MDFFNFKRNLKWFIVVDMSSWPHAPFHYFQEQGTFMVTAGTLRKEKHFNSPSNLDLLQNLLFTLAQKYQWNLEAWALFPNHYHFVARSPDDPTTLRKFITHLHASSARELNKQCNSEGRRVWHNYWDMRITFQNSYFARLKYVMNNPVKHGVVRNVKEYRWCSAHWFAENASKSYYKTVESFKIDRLNIRDDFWCGSAVTCHRFVMPRLVAAMASTSRCLLKRWQVTALRANRGHIY